MQVVLETLQSYWHPRVERCGFVTRDNEIVEVDNLHPNPTTHFAITDVPANAIALWHTHPSGCCNLSVDDYELFKRLPQLIHIIVGQTDSAYYYVDTDESVIRGDNHAG